VLIKCYDQIPGCIALVVNSALSPNEADNAFLGAGAYFGFTQGLKRALFSSEAGQGSAPIAHAAARTDKPAREGVVGGLEPFIDTLVICTLTAMVILVTGTWNRDALGELPARVEIQSELTSGDPEITLAPTVPVEELPAPHGGHSWRSGDTLFVLVEHNGDANADTGNTRMRLRGVIERGTGADELPNERLTVNWASISVPDDATEVSFVSRGVYRDLDGAPLTGYAFDRAFPGLGKWLISIASLLFAVSTMISWSYYGEMATLFLFGQKMTVVYKVIFLVFIAIAPLAAYNSAVLLTIIDLGTGLMLWANLPILFLFGGRAVMNLNGYVKDWRSDNFVRGRKPPKDSGL
jgi:AGCS family alanine or glycine:cation symporter